MEDHHPAPPTRRSLTASLHDTAHKLRQGAEVHEDLAQSGHLGLFSAWLGFFVEGWGNSMRTQLRVDSCISFSASLGFFVDGASFSCLSSRVVGSVLKFTGCAPRPVAHTLLHQFGFLLGLLNGTPCIQSDIRRFLF